MKFLAIIQARCGSSRLPGKVLKELCGKTALERVIERVEKSKYMDEVVVATTFNQEDISIVNLISGMKKRVFAGNALDVLDRFYQISKLIRPEYVVRITADCPVFDYEILDNAIEQLRPETDYMAAVSETLADGLDFEIIRYEALKYAWKEAKLASEREHVTMYIKNHRSAFCIQDYTSNLGNLHEQRWTIDEPEDYLFIKTIYEHFYKLGKSDFLSVDILKYLEEYPSVTEINKGFIRNEGLLISLQNDREIMKPEEE